MFIFSFPIFIALFSCGTDATIEIFDPSGRKVETFPDQELTYDVDFAEAEGFIVLADPPDACTAIAEPTFFTNFTYKFVLINGSDVCSVKRKATNAENANYDFAVLFNPFPEPIDYYRFGYSFGFPVVAIALENGIIIKNSYLYNNSCLYNYRIRVTPNPSDYSKFVWLFGAVIGVCFFVMLLFMTCMVIRCIQERRRMRRNRLSSCQIKQIPTTKFSKGDQYDVCAICLEDYNEGDKLRILPCDHAYHAKCIDPWLMNNRRNCPLCKRKITFGDSADESDSEDSELTSPAENTPLLTSPFNQAQSWGTFVNSIRTMNNTDAGGPSSLPDSFQYSETLHPQSTHSAAAGNSQMSDSESECLLPPSHFSVNNEKEEHARCQVAVQVDFARSENESSTNHATIV